jgi:DNA-binding NarL/FixJ family response regulator
MIRLLIVHDQSVVRDMLGGFVDAQPDMSVVATTAADPPTVLRLTAEHRPHVVLLDSERAGLDGVEIARCLGAECPAPVVLVLAGMADPALEQAMWEADVTGYMFTTHPGQEMLAAIRTAARVPTPG